MLMHMIEHTAENYRKQIDGDKCRWMQDVNGQPMLCHDDKADGKIYCDSHCKVAYLSLIHI